MSKMPAPVITARATQLILAGQVNHVVGEVELHFVKREVRERDLLRINDITVAIVAEDGCAAVGANLQLPDLKFFLGNTRLMLLGDCDDVEQPIGSALLGKELSAVGIEHGAIDAVAIPVFRAGEFGLRTVRAQSQAMTVSFLPT